MNQTAMTSKQTFQFSIPSLTDTITNGDSSRERFVIRFESPTRERRNDSPLARNKCPLLVLVLVQVLVSHLDRDPWEQWHISAGWGIHRRPQIFPLAQPQSPGNLEADRHDHAQRKQAAHNVRLNGLHTVTS